VALCEHCRAELAGDVMVARLPEPWIDHDRHAIHGVHVPLMEWRVLELLYARRRSGPVSEDTMMTILYSDKPDDPPQETIIKVFMCKLRQKLKPTPFGIRTIWGQGYEWVEGEIAEAIKARTPSQGYRSC
jgi:DNA-binding response OmpR family regulator